MFGWLHLSLRTMRKALVILFSIALIIPATPAQAVPNEPAYDTVSAETLWNQGFLGEGTTVALIDQGLNPDHPYFEDRVIDGVCVYTGSGEVCPNGSRYQTGVQAASQKRVLGLLDQSQDHGNMTAGIVAGKPNNQAPGGIAPESKILMANTDFYPESIVQILDYIYDKREEHNIVALSMSFGVFAINSREDLLSCATNQVYADVRDRLNKLRGVGIIPFAASGNGYNLNSAENWAPTCLEEAVSVGSINTDNEVSIYTTMSDKVELLAPDYTRSANTYSYRTASGTSAATPLVAGAYALLRQKYPDFTAQQILNAMKNGGTPIDDVIIKGTPALNLEGADYLLQDLLGDENQTEETTEEEDLEKKITVGTFNGFIAIFTRGYEGQKLSAKVAGKWLVQDPIENYKNFDYSRVTRNTGAGFDIRVDLYIDGEFVRTENVTTR